MRLVEALECRLLLTTYSETLQFDLGAAGDVRAVEANLGDAVIVTVHDGDDAALRAFDATSPFASLAIDPDIDVRALVAADLDGDGIDEIALAHDDVVEIFDFENGAFSLASTIAIDASVVAASDPDAEGMASLAIASRTGSTISIFEDGELGPGIGVGGVVDALAFASLDDDAGVELVVSSGGTVTVGSIQGGLFVADDAFDLTTITGIALADLDADGLDSLLVTTADALVEVAFNGEDGLFSRTLRTFASPPVDLHASDTDGDGTDEAIVSFATGVLVIDETDDSIDATGATVVSFDPDGDGRATIVLAQSGAEPTLRYIEAAGTSVLEVGALPNPAPQNAPLSLEVVLEGTPSQVEYLLDDGDGILTTADTSLGIATDETSFALAIDATFDLGAVVIFARSTDPDGTSSFRSFTLPVIDDDHPDAGDWDIARDLDADGTTGDASATGVLETTSDVDLFQFTLLGPGPVTFGVLPDSTTDVRIRVHDSDMVVRALRDSGDAGESEVVTISGETGETFFIEIDSRLGDTGTYEFGIDGPSPLQTTLVQLSPEAYDGAGDDVTLTIVGPGLGAMVDLAAGASTEDMTALGAVTNDDGDIWTFSIDLGDIDLEVASYIRLTSAVPLTVTGTTVLHTRATDIVDADVDDPVETAVPDLDVLTDSTYAHVGELLRWNGTRFVPVDEETLASDLEGLTPILIAHGWERNAVNMGGMAETIMRRSDADQFVILAVDWRDGGSAFGSDPNGVDDDLGTLDAVRDLNLASMNASNVGLVIGERLFEQGVDASSLILIGFDAGASLTASIASVLHTRGGTEVGALLTVDAPYLTTAHLDADRVAGSASIAWNFYEPVTPSNDASLGTYQSSWDTISTGSGLGAPHLSTQHATNFEITTGEFGQGSSRVYNSFGRSVFEGAGWGFDAIVTTPDAFGARWIWVETEQGVFEPTLDTYGADEELAASFDDLASNAGAAGGLERNDLGAAIGGGFDFILRGINSRSFTRIRPNARPSILLELTPSSPAYATLDLEVPEDAAVIRLTATVRDAGNDDVVLVALDDRVVGQIDLASVEASGSATLEFWIAPFEGMESSLQFLLPSDAETSASFVVSNIEFGILPGIGTLGVPPSVGGFDADRDPVVLGEVFELVASDVLDAVGDAEIFFYRDADGDGLFDENDDVLLGSDADGSDGWSLPVVASAAWGEGEQTFFAYATDSRPETGAASTTVVTIVDPLAGLPGAGGKASIDSDGALHVVTISAVGRPILFTLAHPNGVWTASDLGEATSQATVENVTLWTVGSEVHIVALTSGTLLHLREVEGEWVAFDLSDALGLDPFAGPIDVMVDATGLAHLVGSTEGGHTFVLSQVPSTIEEPIWTATNLNEEITDPAFPVGLSGIDAYVAPWGTLTLVGLDEDGAIWSAWAQPGVSDWQGVNLSDQTGAPALEGNLTVYLTSWSGINIAGTEADGDVVVTWWVPQFGSSWEVDDLSSDLGRRGLVPGSLSSYVTSWDGLNIAGLDESGAVVAYWWAPGLDAWRAESLSIDLGEEAPVASGPIWSIASDSSLSILFQNESDNDLNRIHWAPGQENWSGESLTAGAFESNRDTEVGPFTSSPDVAFASATDGTGRLHVFGANDRDEPILFIPDEGVRLDLGTLLGAPAVTGDGVAFFDPVASDVGFAYPSGTGLALVTRRDGEWVVRSLTGEVPDAPGLESELTPLTFGGLVRFYGLVDGSIGMYAQTGEVNARGDAIWEYMSLTSDVTGFEQFADPTRFVELTAWTYSWGYANVGALDEDGDLWTFYMNWVDFDGFEFWYYRNLTDASNAPRLTGNLDSIVPSWDAVSLTATNESGDTISVWFAGYTNFGDEWRWSNLSSDAAGRRLDPESIVTFSTPWDGLVVAGVDDDDQVVVYWWAPAVDEWVAESITAPLDDLLPTPAGRLGAIVTDGGTQNIFGVDEDGRVIRLHWSLANPFWDVQDLSS